MPVLVELAWMADQSGASRAVSDASSLGGWVAVCGKTPGSVVVVGGSVEVVVVALDVVVVVVVVDAGEPLPRTELSESAKSASTVTPTATASTWRRR
jgi:hypothetical protein